MKIDMKDLKARAAQTLERQIAGGVPHYERSRHLRRLLPLAPEDFARKDVVTARRILLRLANAMREERRRGRMGHWTYDLNRHIALAQAYRAEREALHTLDRHRESHD